MGWREEHWRRVAEDLLGHFVLDVEVDGRFGESVRGPNWRKSGKTK